MFASRPFSQWVPAGALLPRTLSTLILWLVILLGSRPFISDAQTIAVPLGEAARFGLLSGGSIITDSLIGVRVFGAVGADSLIIGQVNADSGYYRPAGPAATNALNDLATARAYCTNLVGQVHNGFLTGQLAPGVYNITGDLVLDSLNELTFSGNMSSVYVFNITGSMIVSSKSLVSSSSVRDCNVFWNVQGSVNIESMSGLFGVVLAGGNIRVGGVKTYPLVLLSDSDIRLFNINTSLGCNDYFSYDYIKSYYPSSLICASQPFDGNLVRNGSFEDRPTNSVTNSLGCPPGLGRIDYACFWDSGGNMASPDYFNTCASTASGANIDNFAGYQLGRNGGDGYTGIAVASVPDNGALGDWREYVSSGIPTLQAGSTYYAEFYWSRGESTNVAISDIGIYFSKSTQRVKPNPYQVYMVEDPASQGNWVTVTPQIANPDNLSSLLLDANGWNRIAGVITPQIGDDFDRITIGSFKQHNRAMSFVGPTTTTGFSFYYIEDILLWKLPAQPLPATFCLGQSVLLGPPTAPLVPPALNVSYRWDIEGPTGIFTPAPAPCNNYNYNATLTGNYRLTVYINNSFNKIYNPIAVTSSGSALPFVVTQSSQCVGGTITLSTPPVTGFSYEWGLNGAYIGSGPTIAVTPTTTTTYTVTANSANCSAIQQVTVYALPAFTVSQSTDCSNHINVLNAFPSVGYIYEWTLNGDDVGSGASLVVNPATTTTYTVTAFGANGCSASQQVTVYPIPPQVAVTASAPYLDCIAGTGGSVLLTASTGFSTYQWFLNSTSNPPLVNNTASPNTFSATQPGLYIVRVTLGSSPCSREVGVVVNNYFDQNSGVIISSGTLHWDLTHPHPDRIRGTVRVKGGAKLIIEDITLVFADTRAGAAPGNNSEAPTRIVVEKGGYLVVNRAHLIGVREGVCGHLMWDGIVVQGNPLQVQVEDGDGPTDPSRYQGRLDITNSTIEDARYGIVAGHTSYAAGSTLVTPTSNTEGGGRVTATNTDFLRCYVGAWFMRYPNLLDMPPQIPGTGNGTTNRSRFTGCFFVTDAKLKDPVYTSGAFNNGTQCGIKVFDNTLLTILGTRFSGMAQNPATGASNPSTGQRGTGIYAYNSRIVVDQTGGILHLAKTKSTFQNLQYGINLQSTNSAYGAKVVNSLFTRNVQGMLVNSNSNVIIESNRFEIGWPNDPQEDGLALSNTYGFSVKHNTFSSYTHNREPLCTGARGITVTMSDGPGGGKWHNYIFSNALDSLFDGIYATGTNNTRLQITCNLFQSPVTHADIEVNTQVTTIPANTTVDFLENPQGDCGISNSEPGHPANNTFHTSGTCTSATGRVFWLRGLASRPLVYNALPGFLPGTNCVISQNGGTLAPYPCTSYSSTYCQDSPTGSRAQLLATLDTLTNVRARADLINELLRQYLSDTVVVAGIDSAQALLLALNEPGYQSKLSGIQAITGSGGGSQRVALVGPKVHRGFAQRFVQRPGGGTSVGTRTRQGQNSQDYFEKVRNLLRPLGNDSIIALILAADAGLRGQLEAIANDTLTWGFEAGRAALHRYLGYEYESLRPDDHSDGEHATGARLAAPGRSGTAALGQLTETVAQFYPNPTDGTVRVSYNLPVGAESGQVQLTDYLGRRVQVVALPGTGGETQADLTTLAPGVYSYTIWVGEKVLQAGKLVKLP